MKIIAIFLLANIGCSKTIEQLNANATKQLESIVEKYKYLATENAELSQWIKKLLKASKGNAMLAKMKLHAQFLLYDERRKYEEGRIKSRMNAIDDLIKDTKISKKCRKYYQRQKKSLQMAYKFSNKTKLSNILKNSKTCDEKDEKDESNEENDEYSYY